MGEIFELLIAPIIAGVIISLFNHWHNNKDEE